MARADRARGFFVGMTPGERASVLLFLAALVLGLGAFNLWHSQISLFQVWLAFIAYAIVLALPFIWYRSGWGWLHPLIFWVLWVGLVRSVLPKIGVYANGLLAHRVMPGAGPSDLNAVVVEALLLTTVGWLAMYVGFIGSPKLAAPRLAFGPPRNLTIKTALVAVVALGALLFLITKAGGVGHLMLQRGLPSEAQIFTDSTVRIGQYLVGILKPACLVWFALRPKVWRNPIWLSFFVLAITIDFIATGSRSGVAIPVLMAGVIWMLHYRRVPYIAIIVAAVFSMAVLGIGGAFRQASRGADSVGAVELNTSLSQGVVSGFEGMVSYGSTADGTYGILASVPERHGFLFGESYLSIPFAPVPNALLPFEKPHAGGKLNAERIFGIPSGGVPPGSIGEAYWNFGIPGVTGVMLLFGVVLRWFYRLYKVNHAAGWVMIVYVISLFSLRPNSPAFYSWLQAVIPVSFSVLLFCGLPKKRQAKWLTFSPKSAANRS